MVEWRQLMVGRKPLMVKQIILTVCRKMPSTPNGVVSLAGWPLTLISLDLSQRLTTGGSSNGSGTKAEARPLGRAPSLDQRGFPLNDELSLTVGRLLGFRRLHQI